MHVKMLEISGRQNSLITFTHTSVLHFVMAIIRISFKAVSLPMMATSKTCQIPPNIVSLNSKLGNILQPIQHLRLKLFTKQHLPNTYNQFFSQGGMGELRYYP